MSRLVRLAVAWEKIWMACEHDTPESAAILAQVEAIAQALEPVDRAPGS
jgi:hypothetical protein